MDEFNIEDQANDDFIDGGLESTDELKKIEKDRKQYYLDMQSILELPHGKNVIWVLMEKFGAFRETFCGESTHNSAYNQGRASCAREILNDVLQASPKAYAKIIEERLKLENLNNGDSK
ncbi:hypothetical protein OP256_001280 [Vibrio parahaemolyticus]|nr:hypothetical protein [Vibrio parahaemolyticus]